MSIVVAPNRTLPGIYTQVFEEGLIAAPLGVQGVVGIIGTSRFGPLLTPVSLSSFTDAMRAFGGLDENLTLIKAMELAFDNGATNVVGIRVGPAVQATASFSGSIQPNVNVLTLTAIEPGAWGNSVSAAVQYAYTTDKFAGDGINSAFTLSNTPTGSLNASVYPYINATVNGSSNLITSVTGSVVYLSGSIPSIGSTVLVNYNYTSARQLIVSVTGSVLYGVGYRQESWNNIISVNDLLNRVNVVITGSTLVSGSTVTVGTDMPLVTASQNLMNGNDGAAAVNADYLSGLTTMDAVDPCNLVVLAGQDSAALHASLSADVDTMSNDTNQKNRLGVAGGALGEAESNLFNRMQTLDDYRMIFVAPGLQIISRQTSQPVYRSGAYMAAAVAGLISGLPVHYSPTNKTLTGMYDLEIRYGGADLQNFILNRITAIFVKNGIRVLKGITSSSNPAWQQITTIRITDAAISVVRANAQPYIGKLNNKRIRAAMQASVNAGLYDMYLAEMLVPWTTNGILSPGFQTTVYASRTDEIMGIARIDIILQPVFSIDYVIVSIYLQ